MIYFETKLQTTCFDLIESFFEKTKKVWNYYPHLHSLQDFQQKIFLLLYFINWPNFIVSLSSWDIGQYVYCSCLLTNLWRHIFDLFFQKSCRKFFFQKKSFLMLYFVNWPNFISWLPLLLEILGNMCIAIVC